MKPFWQSKVFWLNAIAILVLIGDYLFTNHIIPAEWGVLVLGILNIILRFLTSQAVTTSNPIKDK